MAKSRLFGWLLLTLYFAEQSFSFTKYERADKGRDDVCDNGIFKIQEDLVDAGKECNEQPFEARDHTGPGGEGYCHDPPVAVNARSPVCMDTHIIYPEQIPSSGDYRPYPPVYGEYDYLPPQRWLCALTYGAIAFLYHPCAPEEEVMELRKLARTCLRKHIITPYPKLSENFPLALVSWGCIYKMAWVDSDEASQWIQNHALKTPLARVQQVGGYNYGLEKDAATYTLSSVNHTALCPAYEIATIENPDALTETTATPQNFPEGDINPTPTPKSTSFPSLSHLEHHQPSPASKSPLLPPLSGTAHHQPSPTSESPSLCENPSDDEEGQDGFVASHAFLLLMILLLSAVVLALTVVTLWVCCCREGQCCRHRLRHSRGKYKAVSKFFVPLFGRGGSEGKIVSIAIPEMGVPNAMPSEREKLLIESDEEEV